jgi:kinesin family protein 15
MATREVKTPRGKAGGGRFNTIATSTPSKGMAMPTVKPLLVVRSGSGSEAQPPVQTPKRGGALFDNSSPMVGQVADEQKDAGNSTIKVIVRVRPMSSTEKSAGRAENVVSVPTTDTVVLQSSEPKPFTFDYVADSPTTQSEMFDMIGRPFTDSCLKGYNGCIFAYGQTGSGKTFTMQGPEADVIDTESQARGLIPRTFEYLFERIAQKEATANASSPGSVQFTVRFCYMEIYNEAVTDLLDPSKANLAVRENNKDGIYVDGITWQEVRNAEACVSLLHKGLRNRKVSETSMNKESSRSHSLLTLKVESTHVTPNGVTKRRNSCLNLVDLAGSERQKSTNASGDRLKEASNINRSLSALGNVIMALADMSDGKARHVHYRDSKLTFLLKDSLGGNSKTAIISNISPADTNFGETLSTLKFAQRAKLIKTRAILNEDTNGSMDQLRAEIKRLKAEVAAAKGKSAPLTDGEVTMGRLSEASGGTPSASDGVVRGGDDATVQQLHERINALENLLYQSMEAQTVAETKYHGLLEIEQESLKRCALLMEEDNALFASLKMQLKLKTESLKHLASKKPAPADAGEPAGSERVEGMERELAQLRSENAELRKAQEAPLSNYPEFRAMMVDNSKLSLAIRATGAFIVESNTSSGTVKLTPNPELEERQHLEKMAREVRDQFMNAVKDKKRLAEELAAASSSSANRRQSGVLPPISVGAVVSPASQDRLAAMTTPERHNFQSMRLQMWREEQAFDERRRRLEEELDSTKREVIALQTQLSSAVRRADFAVMELEELKPGLRRMSAGGKDMGDAASEIERIAKRAAEARMLCESEKQSRAAAEAALNDSSKLSGDLRAAQEALEEAHKREARLQHQLEAAEYAVAASERRAHKQQRASLVADPGRLGKLQEDNEQLQLRLANLQDEYESRKEEFAFLEGKVERITKEFSQQEEHARAQSMALEATRASLCAEQQRVADLEAKLTEVTSGDEAQAALVQALQDVERKVGELEKKLEESVKNEDTLRDSLAHQQEVHEALQRESAIAQAVLEETMKTLTFRTTSLEQMQADMNDKASETRELSDKLDSALADLEHSNRTKVCVCVCVYRQVCIGKSPSQRPCEFTCAVTAQSTWKHSFCNSSSSTSLRTGTSSSSELGRISRPSR